MTKTDSRSLPSRACRAPILAAALLLAGAGSVRAEPPIKSAQDAACRNEARARVFSTPDPRGLGLHAIGRQIYMACMRRSEPRRRRR